MRFTPSFLDDLRARVPVSTVVARKVRLKKQGREWRGLSPFTAEKTPSFFVNDQKGRWFDFSAGKNGNIFDFLMETEGLSFPEAVEALAGEAGVALPAQTREDVAREAQRVNALDALEQAARFFETQLRGRAGERARNYLASRGIDEALQSEFRIGFAPREKFALRDHLAREGTPPETMIEGGLLIHGEGVETPYDRFRDRVIFPICDRSGRVIAFGGRALDAGAPAKYLNSPETALFHKGAGLYNHHRARRAASETGRAIVVEGYIDVIAMHAAGYPETVAPLGTALTPEQCALLWGMAPDPILCFDGDKAGQKAAWRALETALPLLGGQRTFRFALLPEGLDPDDLARSGGSAAIEAVLTSARPLVDALWARERDAKPLNTPEQRTDLLTRLAEATEAIGDRELRRAYFAELRSRGFDHFRASRPARASAERRAGPDDGRGAHRIVAASDTLMKSPLFSGAGVSQREAVILTALLDFPDLIAAHPEEIAALHLSSPEADRLRQAVLALADSDADAHGVAATIESAGLRPVAARMAERAGAARIRGGSDSAGPLDAAAALRQALVLQLNGPTLSTALRAALAAYDTDPSDRNWQVLRDVRGRASSKDGLEASDAGQ